jgi:hypothetical protein
VYAKNTLVLLATIGTKTPAAALALLKNAEPVSIGTLNSANADALLLIAAVILIQFTESTTLRLALAFVLKTHRTNAKLANISIMLLVNASARLKTVKIIITGTPEFATAFQITADAKLVSTGILMPKPLNVNA